MEDLNLCLDCFHQDVFRAVTNSLENMTSYFFCEDNCIPSDTWVSYNNDKPQFTATLKHLGLEKEEAFRSGDKDWFKGSKYRFSQAVRDTQHLYSDKLQL